MDDVFLLDRGVHIKNVSMQKNIILQYFKAQGIFINSFINTYKHSDIIFRIVRVRFTLFNFIMNAVKVCNI